MLVRTCRESRTLAWEATESMGRDTWYNTQRFRHLYRGSSEMPVAEEVGGWHYTEIITLIRFDMENLKYTALIIKL